MNAREVALAAVRDVFPRKRASANAARRRRWITALRRSALDARDRAFAAELAYGAIKMRRTLDWYLAPFIGERRKELPPAIVEILRLAVYEIVFTRADEHATVFEFVNLAKKYGHRGVANLVNAVLRSFLREPARRARALRFRRRRRVPRHALLAADVDRAAVGARVSDARPRSDLRRRQRPGASGGRA